MDGDVDGRMDWLVDGCLDELMETGREGGCCSWKWTHEKHALRV